MQRRVASGAAHTGGRILDVERVGNLFGARSRERGRWSLRMEIFERPDEKLILGLATAAVAAGTGICAEKFWGCVCAVCGGGRQKNCGDKTCGLATNCFTHSAKLVNGVTP